MHAPLNPWRVEIRAMVALALPLILANLAQSVIHATDLIFLGRLGPDALAAGSLGINLYVPFLLFGMGLIAAVAPMVAAERGRKAHSVRDIRRTVRQGMWLAVTLCIPFWIILWNAEPILLAMGQDPELSRQATNFIRILQWGLLPAFLQLALRNFVSAIERPGWGTVVLFGAVFINALLGWALIFGHLGMPKLGLEGAALASALANLFLFVGLALAMGVGFMACMALTLILIPQTLVGIFIDVADAKNAEVVGLAVGFLGVAALFQIVDGAQVVGAGVLRGLQDTRWPMIYAAIGYWVIGIGIGVALAFPLGMRGLGVWYGLAAGLAFVAVVLVIRWMQRERLGLLGDSAPGKPMPIA